jgi:hypothetical protein
VRPLRVALLPLIALLVTGCFGSSTPPASSAPTLRTPAEVTIGSDAVLGRVSGTLKVIGGPCVCPRPQPHTVFRILADSRVVQVVKTDAHGRFFFGLPAGTYHLTTAWFQGLPIRPQTIRVSAGVTIHVSLKLVV